MVLSFLEQFFFQDVWFSRLVMITKCHWCTVNIQLCFEDDLCSLGEVSRLVLKTKSVKCKAIFLCPRWHVQFEGHMFFLIGVKSR